MDDGYGLVLYAFPAHFRDLSHVKLRTGNWHYSSQVLQCNHTIKWALALAYSVSWPREDATARVLEEFVGVGVANPGRCTEPRNSYSLSSSIFWVQLM